MAAYWYSASTPVAPTTRWTTYTVTTADTTCATTYTVSDYYQGNARWVSLAEPLPKAETDSLIVLTRMDDLGIDPLRTAPVRKPASVGRARTFRHLPRGKLERWPSLKEKRIAWGTA